MTPVDSDDSRLNHSINDIKARAENLGFCFCGITSADPMNEYPRYLRWLETGNQGPMSYFDSERHREMRKGPKFLVPWVKSILVFAWPYKLNHSSAPSDSGQIAGYVSNEDYHMLLPNRLQALVNELPQMFNCPVQSKTFCDSAPILERELGVRAGVGWIGKNSCLIHPRFGSAFLMTEIFIDIVLPTEQITIQDRCGACHKCIDACPTGCILPDRTIDARKCISTLTIENKGLLDPTQRKSVGNHVFGCDICQIVCPWNHRNQPAKIESCSFSLSEMMEILDYSEENFKSRFSSTAFMRSKRSGLLRNLCAVLGNSKSPQSQKKLENLLQNEVDPIVCITAAQVLFEINPDIGRQAIKNRLKNEANTTIQLELGSLIK